MVHYKHYLLLVLSNEKCGPVDKSIETTDEHFNDVELLSDISLITLF